MKVPYHSHTNPEDEIAQAAAQIRHAELRFWREHLPEFDNDIELAVQRMFSATGISPARISKIFMALDRLESMPELHALQERYLHLDLDRLIAINESLDKLGEPLPGALARIDAGITKYLTPKRANQVPPTQANIKRKLNELISAEDDTIALQDTRRRGRYSTDPFSVTLEADPETIASIDQAVRAFAEAEQIPLAQAMTRLILGEAQPKVILHTYQATDIPGAPTFIQGHGWSRTPVSPSEVHELDPYAESKNYITPANIRKYVEGRDGTCRYPGCNHPAYKCQTDHRINFADGGPTTPANLACLCQHHHNIKTDGTAFYIMDPYTGDIFWLFEDGTWKATAPTGPIAEKNWAQTFAQAIASRRRRAHEQAVALKEEIKS
ncbi:TPA: HNH endonuclease [Corynebacterium striatum]|nr:HNH endonuclease [Corynebacterium striatum]